MATCIECGSQGKSGGCPECGINSDKLVLDSDIKKEKLIRRARYCLIPDHYIGQVWSKDILIESNPELQSNFKFMGFCTNLERLHDIFKRGEIPTKSAFISAKSKMSKWIFAYSCMQFAIRANLSVAPIIDTIDLKRLLVLGAENPTYKLYGNIDYDQYLGADICFVSVTKTDKFTEAYTLIIELIAKRARMGLPTFVLSKFTLKEISQDCFDSDYRKFMDTVERDNDLKYPVILEC